MFKYPDKYENYSACTHRATVLTSVIGWYKYTQVPPVSCDCSYAESKASEMSPGAKKATAVLFMHVCHAEWKTRLRRSMDPHPGLLGDTSGTIHIACFFSSSAKRFYPHYDTHSRLVSLPKRRARFSVGSIARHLPRLAGKKQAGHRLPHGTPKEHKFHLFSRFFVEREWFQDTTQFTSRARDYYVRMRGSRSSYRASCILPVARAVASDKDRQDEDE